MLSKRMVVPALVFLVVLAGCANRSLLSEKFPSITVDKDHNQFWNGKAYTIPPSLGLVVESGPENEFLLGKGTEAANWIHVMYGVSDFRVGWDGRGKVVLDSSTLDKVTGSKPFPGFVAGEIYSVWITHEGPPGPDQRMNSGVNWAGQVRVK